MEILITRNNNKTLYYVVTASFNEREVLRTIEEARIFARGVERGLIDASPRVFHAGIKIVEEG